MLTSFPFLSTDAAARLGNGQAEVGHIDTIIRIPRTSILIAKQLMMSQQNFVYHTARIAQW